MKSCNIKLPVNKVLAVVLAGLCFFLNASVCCADEEICGGPNDVPLCAGQNIDVGRVTVQNDATNLYVTYNIEDANWILLETHLAVGTSLSDIPQTKKGNPIPGQFPYSDDHDPCDMVSMFTYEIPLSEFDANNLFIAAHAVVARLEQACIDFESEQYQEKDEVGIVSTDVGDVNFYMVSSIGLPGLSIGDDANLAPVEEAFPVIAAPDTKPPDSNIVAFTVGSSLRDDYVSDDRGTGAGGKTLTDPQDLSQVPLLQHAYSQSLAIVIDVTDIYDVQVLNLVCIDLDHNENWTFQYFDKDDKLIYQTTLTGLDPSGDGAAFPVGFSSPEIRKVAIWGGNNLGIAERIGYAIDNICITAVVEDETAWGDGCDGLSFPWRNWATYFEYEIGQCLGE